MLGVPGICAGNDGPALRVAQVSGAALEGAEAGDCLEVELLQIAQASLCPRKWLHSPHQGARASPSSGLSLFKTCFAARPSCQSPSDIMHRVLCVTQAASASLGCRRHMWGRAWHAAHPSSRT